MSTRYSQEQELQVNGKCYHIFPFDGLGEGNTAQRKDVELGGKVDGLRIVTAGLEATDRVPGDSGFPGKRSLAQVARQPFLPEVGAQVLQNHLICVKPIHNAYFFSHYSLFSP